MGSIFRIAKAEFIKIFKRPTVYIMAFVLAAVIGGSLFLYSSNQTSVNYNVNFGKLETVSQMHNNFKDEKILEYNKKIDLSKNEIKFFKTISSYKTEYKKTYDDIINFYDSANTNTELKDFDTFFNNYNKFVNLYINQSFINKLTSTPAQALNDSNLNENTPSSNFFLNFYKSDLYKNIKNTISTNYSELSTTYSTNKNTFKNVFLQNNNNIKNGSKDIIIKTFNVGMNPTTSLLNAQIEIIKNDQKNYIDITATGSNSNGQIVTKNEVLRNSLYNFEKYFLQVVEFETYTFAIMNEDDFRNMKSGINNYNTAITPDTNMGSTLSKHQKIVNKLKKDDYISQIQSNIENIVILNSNFDLLNNLEDQINKSEKNIATQLNIIDDYAIKNSPEKDINIVNNYINYVTNYKEICNSTYDYIYNSIQNDLLKDYSDFKIQKFHGKEFYNSYNSYHTKQEISRNKYFLDNDIYKNNVDNVFAFDKNSGQETSVYDFMYFSIKISIMVIIIFTIFMSASIFAAEHDSGTIKLLLIRPFKRYKIVTGKLFAALFFSTTFLLFSSLLSFIIGACVFTFPTNPILVTFNATTSFLINPALLMLIYIGFSLLEIIFYCILASSLCTLFKSYPGAITVSFIVYFATLGMNLGLGNKLWYSYSPFVNINLFKFFGNGFLFNPNSKLTLFFNSPMLGNMNFFLSLGLSLGLITILLTATYIVFKKRDY